MSATGETFDKPAAGEGRKLSGAFTLMILLLVSATLNVLLGFKVGALKETVAALKSEGRLAVGASVPPIEAADLNGNPVTVAYAGGGEAVTVLYVFSPSCGWCERNLRNVEALAAQSGGRYRLIGLSLSEDKLREYVEQQKFTFPVYSKVPAAAKTAYKLGGTPQTIVVSDDGRVLKNWAGAFASPVKGEIEEYFKIQLPGLTEKAKAEPASSAGNEGS